MFFSNFCSSWIAYLPKNTEKHLKIKIFSQVLSWIRQ